jgi:hypothetical protein
MYAEMEVKSHTFLLPILFGKSSFSVWLHKPKGRSKIKNSKAGVVAPRFCENIILENENSFLCVEQITVTHSGGSPHLINNASLQTPN